MEKITWESKWYPTKLRKIKNPPKQLYVEGNKEILESDGIAIIGSRGCSEEGAKLAKQFSMDLAQQNLTIISGMALGIDEAAHRGALKAGGMTIAVLGSGFHHIFPPDNVSLFSQIIEKGGAVVTEYPPDVGVKSQQFLERNRIVSGLSLGVLVIEAAFRSGTSVTAGIAKAQGKPIFCIPHEIGNKHGVGTNRMLKNGAIAVTEPKDVIDFFPQLTYHARKNKQSRNIVVQVKEEYLPVYGALQSGNMSADAISRKLQRPIQEVNQILFMLELEGNIEKLPQGEYQLKGE